MISIIFYFDQLTNIDLTLESLVDTTNLDDITEIIICNDSGQLLEHVEFNPLITGSLLRIIDSSNIGRAKAWDIACDQASGEQIVFVGGITKFKSEWLNYLLSDLNDNNLVSPIINVLDNNIWQSQLNKWDGFGWGWDFELKNKTNTDQVICVSSKCFAITKKRYEFIGGFDNGMDGGAGEDIELSYRNWIFGGECIISSNSHISSGADRKPAAQSLKNINRIVQIWMPEYQDRLKDYYADLPDTGKISNITGMEKNRVKSNKEILNKLQPELFGVYQIRDKLKGKTIGIVAPGASIDLIDRNHINRNEIIVGIDYAGLIFDCDLVISCYTDILADLADKYSMNQLLLPSVLQDRVLGKYESARDIYPDSMIFECREYGNLNVSINPPFVDIDNIAVTAINLALFMRPCLINLYGYDTRLLSGRSHTSIGGYYQDGYVLNDSESTDNKYKFEDHVMRIIGDVAIKSDIPIIRVNHL